MICGGMISILMTFRHTLVGQRCESKGEGGSPRQNQSSADMFVGVARTVAVVPD